MSAGSNGLAREISALHRGRGLRDPRLSDRVGPTIRAALHVDDAAPDFEVRDRVVAALRSAARTLPGDIQRAFLLASALESDRPTLAERLDEAAAALDRDPRTVRRRLAQADSAVALVLERGARQQPAMEDAWYIESMSSHVDISEDEARTRATKVIVPTQGGLRRISERISLPNAPRDLAPQHHPRIAITAGGHLAQVRHQGSVWSYDIDLDNPLAVGIQQEIIPQIDLPLRSMLAPVLIMVPIRPCRHFDLTIEFGTPANAESVWLVDGEYPTALADEPNADTLVEIPASGSLTARFSGLRAGLAYGLRWQWRHGDL